MSAANIARLTDRGVVSVTGRDSEKLLQGLITNDLEQVAPGATPYPALHAALLSPQGKILFDFFVVRVADGYLLDVDRAKAAELVKRLSMYKLRADVAIADASSRYTVFAIWGDGAAARVEAGGGIHFADPRHPLIGLRLLAEAEAGDTFADRTARRRSFASCLRCRAREAWRSRRRQGLRIRRCLSARGKFRSVARRVLHEGLLRRTGGRGADAEQDDRSEARCENYCARRADFRHRRACSAKLPIGRIGTVDGNNALAMLRLDRAVEAEQKSQKLTAGGIVVTPDAEALARYLATAAARPASALHT